MKQHYPRRQRRSAQPSCRALNQIEGTKVSRSRHAFARSSQNSTGQTFQDQQSHNAQLLHPQSRPAPSFEGFARATSSPLLTRENRPTEFRRMQSPLPPRTSFSLGTGSVLTPSPTTTVNTKAPKKKRRNRNQFAEEERDNPSKRELAGLFSPPQIRRHVTIPLERSSSVQANKHIALYDPNDPSGHPEFLEDPGDHPFDLQSNGFSLNAARSAHENFQNIIDRKPVPLAVAPSPSRLTHNFEMNNAHNDDPHTLTQPSPYRQQFTPERPSTKNCFAQFQSRCTPQRDALPSRPQFLQFPMTTDKQVQEDMCEANKELMAAWDDEIAEPPADEENLKLEATYKDLFG